MHCEPHESAFTRDGLACSSSSSTIPVDREQSHGERCSPRNGNDYRAVFPEVRAGEALPFDDCIIDGEVVCLDANGITKLLSFAARGRFVFGDGDPSRGG